MSKRDEIIRTYHCTDTYGESCTNDCKECEKEIAEMLDDFEKEIGVMKMAEQIKSAIGVLKGLYRCRHELSANECVGRHCNQCECFSEKGKEDKSLTLAIRSLQAWSEVLTELEEERDRFNRCNLKGEVIGMVSAIEVINQKLAEIEK